MKTGFTTNGYYIDRNVAQSIKEANISFVQISIDGTKETHNNIREDEQSFNRAIEAIRLIKEICSIPVTVATTVMPQNLNELPLLTALLISLGVNNWNIGTVMPVGKAKDRESLFLSKSEFIQLLNFIINSKKKINIEITENFPYLGKYDVKIRRRSKICPIGILSCCIGYNGNVRGCPDQPDIPYYQEGNILTKNFATIWQEGFKRYRERIIFIEDKKCFACKYKTDCYGGCWVMRENNYQCILNYFK
jgi:radical SAM protein with 4Fe4S-binding SPASM domain